MVKSWGGLGCTNEGDWEFTINKMVDSALRENRRSEGMQQDLLGWSYQCDDWFINGRHSGKAFHRCLRSWLGNRTIQYDTVHKLLRFTPTALHRRLAFNCFRGHPHEWTHYAVWELMFPTFVQLVLKLSRNIKWPIHRTGCRHGRFKSSQWTPTKYAAK